jgi:hypothetical protein
MQPVMTTIAGANVHPPDCSLLGQLPWQLWPWQGQSHPLKNAQKAPSYPRGNFPNIGNNSIGNRKSA